MSEAPSLPKDVEDQVEAECDALLPGDDAKEKELWHYTTAEGALGIVSKKQIWATHYGFTNDASEIRIGEEVVCKVARQLAAHERDGDRKVLLATLASTFPDHLLSDKADMFVASFTEAENDLVQWSGYGHRGLGYALKINVQAPEPIATDDAKFGGLLAKVEYDQQTFTNLAASKLLQYASDFDKYKSHGEAAIRFLTVCMLRECAALSLRLKHKAFKHEAEWRLLIVPLRHHETPALTQLRPRADVGLVPFVQVDLPDGAIRALMVGPVHAGQEEQRLAAARLLLAKNGYDTRLAELSGIPFRGEPRAT